MEIEGNTADLDSRGERQRELERRIEALESSDEAAFGGFTAWDWTVCTVFCVVLPLLVVWRFAP
jgi:hypothetical protein